MTDWILIKRGVCQKCNGKGSDKKGFLGMCGTCGTDGYIDFEYDGNPLIKESRQLLLVLRGLPDLRGLKKVLTDLGELP